MNNPANVVELRPGPGGHALYLTSGYVMPTNYPKTLESSKQELRRMEDWNNSNANIWKLDLAPWLRCGDHPGCPNRPSTTRSDSGAQNDAA